MDGVDLEPPVRRGDVHLQGHGDHTQVGNEESQQRHATSSSIRGTERLRETWTPLARNAAPWLIINAAVPGAGQKHPFHFT